MWPFKSKKEKALRTLTFLDRGESPVNAVKAVRRATGWGLKDTKMLVDGDPRISLEDLSERHAFELKKKLEEVSPGCKVHLE